MVYKRFVIEDTTRNKAFEETLWELVESLALVLLSSDAFLFFNCLRRKVRPWILLRYQPEIVVKENKEERSFSNLGNYCTAVQIKFTVNFRSANLIVQWPPTCMSLPVKYSNQLRSLLLVPLSLLWDFGKIHEVPSPRTWPLNVKRMFPSSLLQRPK